MEPQSPFGGAEFLLDLQQQWRSSIEANGGHCPCCGRWGKVYKYKLSQHLVMSLKWISMRQGPDGWADVQGYAPRWMLQTKTYPILAHWDLIRARGKKSGYWRVTPSGEQFLSGAIALPKGCFVYNNHVVGFDDDYVSFADCLHEHFDFDQLMSDQFTPTST